jgi:hypothetical protein
MKEKAQIFLQGTHHIYNIYSVITQVAWDPTEEEFLIAAIAKKKI